MKFKTVYECRDCGYQSPKWAGQCPECRAWNTMDEEVVQQESKTAKKSKNITEFSSEITNLKDIQNTKEDRIPTDIAEFDRLLGGGLVPGQMVLLAGAPGIGKSTLMLQVAEALSDNKKVLYISGEESLGQISSRAARLNLKSKNIFLLSETNLLNIITAFEKIKPDVLIIDSIQTVYHPEMSSGAGSIGQIRESAGELLRLAKPKGTILFILGHITKEGELAGPKVLEHMVDTVLYFETERDNILRLLRPHKNRFGSTDEIGLFTMSGHGLEQVSDANAYFSGESRTAPLKGRAYSVALEGTRPILVEVQALVSPTRFPFPKRVATGLDLNRCQILLAALEKYTGLNLDSKDVYINLAGGMKIKDPALDLALCAAVISSAKEVPLSQDYAFIGEVGILGTVSKVPLVDRRANEAGRLGFKQCFTAPLKPGEKKNLSVEVKEISALADLVFKIK